MQGPALGFERQIPAAAAAGFLPLSSSALSAHIINNLIKEGRRTTVTLWLIYGRVLCTQERIRSSSTQFRPAVSKPNSLLHRFKVFFFFLKWGPLLCGCWQMRQNTQRGKGNGTQKHPAVFHSLPWEMCASDVSVRLFWCYFQSQYAYGSIRILNKQSILSI